MSVLSNWDTQVAEHTDGSLSLCLYHGQARHQHTGPALAKHDIVVTTYGCLLQDLAKLKKARHRHAETSSAAPCLPTLCNLQRLSCMSFALYSPAGPYGSCRPLGCMGQQGLAPGLLTTHQSILATLVYIQIEWLRVVLDEGHFVKNANSQQSQAAASLSARARWILSGTPIQNSIRDLYGILAFLHLDPLQQRPVFTASLERPIGMGDPNGLLRLKVWALCLL